ncbi:hypothetical protein IV494_04730 [Kaistella sp. G5-32]|uniref:Lipoprotein n=1 Tax=Kaistella gelatinilytica TaxID=2787636 RepID=A0ABS0FA06_9FLAO|nr:hypothetical protein [Kaistella gelatinilytica]MBF8456480.1 hypothetical protein [Kaistella gelatinilytica]
MKAQILTIALLLGTLSFTSCKKTEGKSTENQATTESTNRVEVSPKEKDSAETRIAEAKEKSSEKGEKKENEANEKNDKD